MCQILALHIEYAEIYNHKIILTAGNNDVQGDAPIDG